MEIIISVMKKSLRMTVFPYELLNTNPAEYTSYPKRKLTVAELARKKHDDLKIISLQDYSKLMSLIEPDDPSTCLLIFLFTLVYGVAKFLD